MATKTFDAISNVDHLLLKTSFDKRSFIVNWHFVIFEKSAKAGSQKKWSVHEGVKMMVTSTLLSGQADLQRYTPVSRMEKMPERAEKGILEKAIPEKPAPEKAAQERNVTVQIAFNGDSGSSKPFGLSSALATTLPAQVQTQR